MYPTYNTKVPACLDFALSIFAEKFPAKGGYNTDQSHKTTAVVEPKPAPQPTPGGQWVFVPDAKTE